MLTAIKHEIMGLRYMQCAAPASGGQSVTNSNGVQLELKLNVEQQNLRIFIALGLHLKASVGEGLFKSNTIYKEAVSQAATLDLFSANHSQIKGRRVKLRNSIHYHLSKEVLLSSNLKHKEHRMCVASTKRLLSLVVVSSSCLLTDDER